MKRYLVDVVSKFFLNKTNGKKNDFSLFLVKENYSKLYLFLVFSIGILLLVLLLSEFNNEYIDIIWAHSILLIFSVSWLFLMRIKKPKIDHRSQWLILIPTLVYIMYSSYLLGYYSYRAVFFSGYTAVIFSFAIIYTAKWQITAMIFLFSIFYIHFLTPYGKTGPSKYISSNLLTLGIIVIIAWFISRFIYLLYKNKFESELEIIKAQQIILNERKEKTKLNETIQKLKDDFDRRINKRTEELKQAKLKAEESDKTKALFLANMSHELRTPLSGIIGTLEMLTDSDMSSDETNSLISMALESSGELKRIIDELMEISRLKAGQFELSAVLFDPKRLFLQSTNLFKISSKDKNLDFKVNLKNLPQQIISDPNRIKQIVDNLLGNAVKFTEKGYVHSSFNVITDSSKGHALSIKIKDTGIGMDDKTQKKLFDYFYQEDNSLQKQYQGIGLGLTLVKHYVQQFEGIINLDSQKYKGTQFEVIIPIRLPEKTTDLKKKSGNNRIIIGTISNVLIVEDNRINRFILRKILQENHIKVLEADNGQKAIDIFKENQIDVVFMDIQMPIMNGYEALKEIQKLEDGTKTPIIAITGYASFEDKQQILDMGFHDYIAKPYEKEDIINCIQKTEKGEYDEKKK